MEDGALARRHTFEATWIYVRDVRIYMTVRMLYAMPLVTLTPRINIPYVPHVRGFADYQWRVRTGKRPGPSGNIRQGQRDRDGFCHGIYFIRQSDNTILALRLPWRIRFYKADQGDSNIRGMCCKQLVSYINGNICDTTLNLYLCVE